MNGGNGVSGQTKNNLAEVVLEQKQSRNKKLMGVIHAATDLIVQLKLSIQFASLQIRILQHAQVRIFAVDIYQEIVNLDCFYTWTYT